MRGAAAISSLAARPPHPDLLPARGEKEKQASRNVLFVMAGLVPAIHVFAARGSEDVDARHEAGHDDARVVWLLPERQSGLASAETIVCPVVTGGKTG